MDAEYYIKIGAIYGEKQSSPMPFGGSGDD